MGPPTRVLVFDCYSGISGDMTLGALLDVGVPEQHLRDQLALLGLEGFRLTCRRDQRQSVTGTKVDVVLTSDDHPAPAGEGGHHQHRSLADITQLIHASFLSAAVKRRSLAVFQTLGRAEAAVHGIDLQEVHFHEVGAVDAIVDIVGAAVCLEWLGADQVWCGSIELGGGMVRCAHGLFPVPAPATARILTERQVPVTTGRVPFEATTPTGAAILAASVDLFASRHAFAATHTGYGLGGKDPEEVPNALRVFLGVATDASRIESPTATEDRLPRDVILEEAVVVEAAIDDMPAEALGAAMDELFAAGARDVTFAPTVMKKSRPGTTVTVLSAPADAAAVRDALFLHTTTIGMRQYRADKYCLRRDLHQVTTPWGPVRVKRVYYKGNMLRAKPEYDDCRRLAVQNGLDLLTIVDSARAQAAREAQE